MNTKKILKYGAIAVGAYLAYTLLFKKKSSDANFANATGGTPSWYGKYVTQYGASAAADGLSYLQNLQKQPNFKNLTVFQQERMFVDYMKSKYKTAQSSANVIASTPAPAPTQSPAPTSTTIASNPPIKTVR